MNDYLQQTTRFEPAAVEARWTERWLDEHLFHAEPDPAKGPTPSSSRRRTSPAICTWATCSTTPSRTSSRAITACRARTPAGCPAPTTPASPRRTWSRRCFAQRALTSRTSGARSSSSRVWDWRALRRHDHRAAQARSAAPATGRARALHPRRGLVPRRAPRVRRPLRRRATSTADSYLVNWCPRCGTAISDLEVEYRDMPGTLNYIRYPTWRRRQRDDRHDAPGDDARRHGRGGEPRRRALQGPRRQDGPPAAARARAQDHRGRARRPVVRHRRPQGHAGARPHRLRHRPHARAGVHPGHRPGRPHDRGRRPVRRARARGGRRARGRRPARAAAPWSRSRTTRTASPPATAAARPSSRS